MIDIFAVVALVGIMIGFITVIGVVIGTMLWLRSDIEAVKSDVSDLKSEMKSEMSDLKSEMKSEMSDLKSDIRAIDERQRRMENDISFIKGALAVAIPGFKEGMEGLVAEASEEETVSEALGD